MGPIKMWKYERFQRSYPPFKWYMICDLWFKLQNCAFVPIYKVNIHIHKVSLQFLIIIKIPKNDEAQQNPKVVWKMCKPGNLENHFSNFGHTHLKHLNYQFHAVDHHQFCSWSGSMLCGQYCFWHPLGIALLAWPYIFCILSDRNKH